MLRSTKNYFWFLILDSMSKEFWPCVNDQIKAWLYYRYLQMLLLQYRFIHSDE
jgi:hypothetical protein